MKKSIFTLLIPFATLLLSCGGEEDSCQDCVNNKVKGEINDLYVRIPFSGNNAPFLVSRDSITQETTGYIVCNSELLNDVEPDKILKINGESLVPCELQENELITLDDFEIVDYCYDPIPESNENYDLFNEWVIYSIETADTILFVPCELYITPTLAFILGGGDVENGSYPNVYSKQTGQNDYSGSYKVSNDSLFLKLGITTFGYIVSTQAAFKWENLLSDVLKLEPIDSTVLVYKISNNILTLQNPTNSTSLKLYIK